MHKVLQIPGQRKDMVASPLVAPHQQALVARHHPATNPLVRHDRRPPKTRQVLD
jgi:hypothetical protein